MTEIQQLLGALKGNQKTGYPCRPKPEVVTDSSGGICRVVTGAAQIRLRKETEAEWEVWAPSLYQSCMKPERIEVRPLVAEIREDGSLKLSTKYASCQIWPEGVKIEVSPWEPKIQKTDCRHCRNCGRCSW